MSDVCNDNLRDKIRDLYDLISFLESELESAWSSGEFDTSDQVYGELVDARKELSRLEEYFV